MRVEIKFTDNAKVPYAVIYTDKLNKETENAVKLLQNTTNSPITALNSREQITVIEPSDIYMVRVENQKTIIYSENEKYQSTRRLYEFEDTLGKDFMRISKFTIISLKKIRCIEPSFNGMMYISLKNGLKDYISRTYLKVFKNYLGI